VQSHRFGPKLYPIAALIPVPAGRPSKLTPELVAKAREIAAEGLPVALMAARLGVGRSTASYWIKNAEQLGEDSLEYQFREAISLADAEKCQQLLSGLDKLATAESPSIWAATWLLTHHPRLRDHFSDAAAERKTERKTVATVLEAVAAAGLPADLEHTLLLQMQARGLGAQAADA
jgi:AcrR family transcriptional regulator